MNIPKTVKIGYKEFRVNLVDGDVIEDNSVCYGTISHGDSIITISTDYSIDLQKCTFIHECIHGINEMVETELTEDQTRKFAKGLYSFIKDNPNIFKEVTNV